jgi:hypothetical protein
VADLVVVPVVAAVEVAVVAAAEGGRHA